MTTCLIIGGYGRAGCYVANLLLRSTDDLAVVVAGRNAGKADRAARWLNARHDTDRARGRAVDASDAASLDAAFDACDLVVVCMPYRGESRTVLDAVARAGIDYVDVNPGAEKQDALDALAPQFHDKDSVVLTDAGVIPGCPSVLVRHVAAHFDALDTVVVDSLYKDPEMAYGGAFDVVSLTAESTRVYRDGAWRDAAPWSVRWCDFGAPYGHHLTQPVGLDELESLPDAFDLDRLELHQAGMNLVTNAILFLWRMLTIARSDTGARLGTKLFLETNRRFTSEPYGDVLLVNARGTRNGQATGASIRLQTDDVYEATSIPVVAAVHQILDGSLDRPACGYMGHSVDTDLFLDQLDGLGMNVTSTLSDTPIDTASIPR